MEADTKRILAVGDFHAPYHHKKATAWAIKLAHELKPDTIVQVGDLMDQFAFSRYPKVIKLSPEEEISLARRASEDLWGNLPITCKRYQIYGNHDDRAWKRALNSAPELAFLVGRGLDDLYRFPGVTTVKESELLLDGIIFQHGHRSKLGDHARYNQNNTVCGHSHVGGVVYDRNRHGPYWELNAGFLGEIKTEAFSYQAQKLINKCTLGAGLVDEYGPRFILYPGK